jgi:hypothetical protein
MAVRLAWVVPLVLFGARAVAAEPGFDDAFFGSCDAAAIVAEKNLVVALTPRIVSVDGGSRGDAAGLQAGDHLVGFDGHRVWSQDEFTLVMDVLNTPQAAHTVVVLRGDQVLELTIAAAPTRRVGISHDAPAPPADAFLAKAGIVHAPAAEPLAWRAWQQVPGREWAALLRWDNAGTHAPDAWTWVHDLDALEVALATQDYAEAAKWKPVAPTPAIQAYCDFLARVAARNRDGERAPDPGALAVSPTRCALEYPWPLITGPDPGQWPDGKTAQAMRDAGRLPAPQRQDAGQWAVAASGLPSAEYLNTLHWAVLDPIDHGGWPFRHSSIYQYGGRESELIELNQRVAQAPTDRWYEYGRIIVQFQVSLLNGDETHAHAVACVDAAARDLAALGKQSPFLAWSGEDTLASATQWFHRTMLRHRLRAAFALAAPQTTLKPSPVFDFLRAGDPGYAFCRRTCIDLLSPSTRAAVVLRALNSHSVDERGRLIAALGPDDGPAARAALLDEELRTTGDELDVDDGPDLKAIIGQGQAGGVLLDTMPRLLSYRRSEKSDFSVMYPLRELLYRSAPDFDLPAIDAATAAIPWEDAARAAPAVEALRLRYGHPVGALRLADACAAHGHEDLARALRQQVLSFFALQTRMEQDVHWPNNQVTCDAEGAMLVLASSPATVRDAEAYADLYFTQHPDDQDWNSAHLTGAQMYLALGRPQDALKAFQQSFGGSESKDHDPFIGPFGVIHGEPRMRTWVLRRLQEAGALDDAARQAIVGRAKPGYLDADAAALLAVDAVAVAQPASGPAPVPAPAPTPAPSPEPKGPNDF